MNDTAAHLVDRVIPEEAPVRQWVLSLPHRVRYLCAKDPGLVRAILRIFLRAVFRLLRRLARKQGIRKARCGSVTGVQRFASSLGLNVHLHALVLDGVYAWDDGLGAPVFHAAPSLREADIARVALAVRRKVGALLSRRGLEEWEGEPSAWDRLCAASVEGRIALGPKRGWRVGRVGDEPVLLGARRGLCAEAEGYNVHAEVRVGAGDRPGLERLCRYLLRPALAAERLRETPDGHLVYALERPWADGTTHLVFEPLEFLERLAALVPPPRAHLVLYHGVLSSHATWRAEAVPRAERPSQEPQVEAAGEEDRVSRPRRLSWAALLRRVFGLDVLVCARCGSRRKVVAFVTDPAELARICESIGVPAKPPPVSPARSPPQRELHFPELP